MTKSPPKKMLKKNDKEERKKRSAALSQPFLHRILNIIFSVRTGYHSFENEKEDGFCTFFSEYETKDNVSLSPGVLLWPNWKKKSATGTVDFIPDLEYLDLATRVHYSKIYYFCGLHIHNRRRDTSIGKRFKRNVNNTIFYVDVDVTDALHVADPIFTQSDMSFVPIMNIISPAHTSPSIFNHFMKCHKRDMSFCLEVNFPLSDWWLQETKMAKFIVHGETMATAQRIKDILWLWLYGIIQIERYVIDVAYNCIRDMWPEVPVRQIRCYNIGSRSNYILKKFFGGDEKVKLIRWDNEEIEIFVQGSRVFLKAIHK